MAILSDFRLRVSRKLGLTNTIAGEQTLIDSWVNEGVSDVLVRTHCTVREGSLAMTAGTATYTLPTSILAVDDVWNEAADVDYPMERVPVDYLNRLARNSNGASPARYYTVEGHDLLKVWPPPASGEKLRLDYVPRPATLVNGTDTPTEIPTQWHKAVELYALWQGADYDDDQSSGQGDRYRRDYLLYIQDIKTALTKMQGNYGRAIVNRRRRRRVASSESAYPRYV